MTDEQFKRLTDLLELNASHMDLLSKAVVELIEREYLPDLERPTPVDLREQINELVESLKRASHAKNVALKFLRNS